MQFTEHIGKEMLSSISVSQVLQTRLEEVNALLALKLKALKKAPEGSLHVSQSNGAVQYYHKTPSAKHGSYIAAKNAKLAQQLAQADYDRKLVASLHQESQVLQKALDRYIKCEKKHGIAEQLFASLSKKKQKLVKPIHLSDEEFSASWSSVSYNGRNYATNHLIAAGQPEHLTARGERVRSKSEIIIADTLMMRNTLVPLPENCAFLRKTAFSLGKILFLRSFYAHFISPRYFQKMFQLIRIEFIHYCDDFFFFPI